MRVSQRVDEVYKGLLELGFPVNGVDSINWNKNEVLGQIIGKPAQLRSVYSSPRN
jgi:hypothetical protein